MIDTPRGPRALIITADAGVEHDELTVPRDRLRERGTHVTHAAVTDEPVRTFRHDLDPATVEQPDAVLRSQRESEFDLLIVPGGTVNADTLRTDAAAVRLVTAFVRAGKPVAAICHGPWLLIEADVVTGETLTSYPSLRTDIVNAGAIWTDQPVVRSDSHAAPLITSRNPGDLTDFVDAISLELPANA